MSQWEDCYHPCQSIPRLKGFTKLNDIEDCKFHKHCALRSTPDGGKRCIIKQGLLRTLLLPLSCFSQLLLVPSWFKKQNTNLVINIINKPQTTKPKITKATSTTPKATVATSKTTVIIPKATTTTDYMHTYSAKSDLSKDPLKTSKKVWSVEPLSKEVTKTTTIDPQIKKGGGFEILQQLSNVFKRFQFNTRVVRTDE